MRGSYNKSIIAPGGVFVNTIPRLRQNRAVIGPNPHSFQIPCGNFLTFSDGTNELPPFKRAFESVFGAVRGDIRTDGDELSHCCVSEVITMRRRQSADEAKDVPVTVRLSNDLREGLRKTAKALGLSQAAIVSLALRRFLKEEAKRW